MPNPSATTLASSGESGAENGVRTPLWMAPNFYLSRRAAALQRVGNRDDSAVDPWWPARTKAPRRRLQMGSTGARTQFAIGDQDVTGLTEACFSTRA